MKRIVCNSRALSRFPSPVRLLTIVVALAAWAAVSHAEEPVLRLEPQAATLSSYASKATFTVLLNNRPVPTSEVSRVFIGIEDKNYGRMVHVAKPKDQPGVVELRPNPEHAEVGSYDLRISVSGKEAVATIFMPLDDLPGMLENQAARLGKSVQQLRKERSLVTYSPHEQLSVELPDTVPEGTLFTIELGQDEKRRYIWRVNGEVVQDGMGKGVLRIAVTEPDLYTISAVEKEDGVQRAQWEGSFRGVAMAPIEWTVPARAPLSLAGPEDYGHYEWRIDGKLTGRERLFEHTFEAPGDYAIECKAISPVNDPNRAFYRVTWLTTVERKIP